MSQFNLDAFDLERLEPEKRKESYVLLLRAAEQAERYEDMCVLVSALIKEFGKQGEGLNIEERNLFSVAFKNSIGLRRASWRTISQDNNPDELTDEFQAVVEKELTAICHNVIDLLQNHLINEESTDPEKEVFYHKMVGDYYRYLAECINTKDYESEAKKEYKIAVEISKGKTGCGKLMPTNPTRLGLALNFSVFTYEILKRKDEACKLAKDAFDEAIDELDQLSEVDYKDSTLIMQLLRDNLTLWDSTDAEED